MLTTVAVENYRSLRRLVVPLRRLNVVTGANGSGKSSLYRALRLLADSSRNGAVAALAREGGLPSTLWAGPETADRERAGEHPVQGTVRRRPVGLRLGFGGTDFGYAMDLGLPVPSDSAFRLDPEFKAECTWSGPVLRPATVLADRRAASVRLRAADGGWQVAHGVLRPFDSMLSELADPQRAPDLLAVRERIRSWRFYDHVRTDRQAPARAPQIGTRTPVLSPDGGDLAAALETIREIGDPDALAEAIDDAFPGSRLEIVNRAGWFELAFRQHGLLRPLGGAEVSDGTLRYLLWVAALLTPRPPTLLVINEPETSLHPDLLGPLAALLLRAAARTQLVTVTHSRRLITSLTRRAPGAGADLQAIALTKRSGCTRILGQDALAEPRWHWPDR
jgi:predicted ATPase